LEISLLFIANLPVQTLDFVDAKKKELLILLAKKRTLDFVGSARSFINSEPVFIEILFIFGIPPMQNDPLHYRVLLQIFIVT